MAATAVEVAKKAAAAAGGFTGVNEASDWVDPVFASLAEKSKRSEKCLLGVERCRSPLFPSPVFWFFKRSNRCLFFIPL